MIVDPRNGELALRRKAAEDRKAQAEADAKRNLEVSRAFQAWLESDEGQRCANDQGAVGEYLRNRLWYAFMAGAFVHPKFNPQPKEKT